MAARRRHVRKDHEEQGVTARKRKRSRPAGSFFESLGVQPVTLQATAVLVLAILSGMGYNRWTDQASDLAVRVFLSAICSQEDVTCHTNLVPARRTQRALRPIPPQQTVLEIPRRLTVWDVDAFRDDFIRQELYSARLSGGSLEAAAFLAAYLALLLQEEESLATSLLDPVLEKYLVVLPTDFSFHPTQWTDKELRETLGSYTSTYDTVVALRQQVQGEYVAFAASSHKFSSQIGLEAYQTARLAVMTRSFGTGVHEEVASDEVAAILSATGVDLSTGSHAMVPVLDLYDHHARPNVGFSYDSNKQAFVVTSLVTIQAGSEIFDSYGRRTDADLFARYGFTNGDGSEHTQASLALWHKVNLHPENVERGQRIAVQKRKQVLRYLQYDDGYEQCVDKTMSRAWKLKQLKFRFLWERIDLPEHWTVFMPPRDPSSTPAAASNRHITYQPPAFDMRELRFDGSWVFSTCRLITLTDRDYDGTALQMLQENLNNESFILPPARDALEFRTLMCVARMSQTALSRFGVTIEQQVDMVARLNREAFQSRNWTVQHLRLGEMQTLEALKLTAFAGLRKTFHYKMQSTEPAFTMRDEPCPLRFQPLLEDMPQ